MLVAAHKEARAGTEPFAGNDIRLLELFAVQVTVAMEYARLARESLERERLRQELEVAAAIQTHLLPAGVPRAPRGTAWRRGRAPADRSRATPTTSWFATGTCWP